jgi:hypothetical protein
MSGALGAFTPLPEPVATYLLAFDASDKIKLYSIHTYLRDNKHIESWWNHLPGVYIFNSKRQLGELQSDFFPFFAGNYYLVIRVIPQLAAGFLPKNAWDWLNSGGNPLQPSLPFGNILNPPGR